jgi:hypothetical protein
MAQRSLHAQKVLLRAAPVAAPARRGTAHHAPPFHGQHPETFPIIRFGTHRSNSLCSHNSISKLSQGFIAQLHASGISIHLFSACQGCAGQDLEYQRVTIGRLQVEGFAVIAPDSFALSNRTHVCLMGDRHVWSVRAAEAAERVIEFLKAHVIR